MPRRIAGTTSLVAFAFCLYMGIRADNTFSTTLTRAMLAMVVTFVIGLIIGLIAQNLLDENMKSVQQQLDSAPAKPPEDAG